MITSEIRQRLLVTPTWLLSDSLCIRFLSSDRARWYYCLSSQVELDKDPLGRQSMSERFP